MNSCQNIQDVYNEACQSEDRLKMIPQEKNPVSSQEVLTRKKSSSSLLTCHPLHHQATTEIFFQATLHQNCQGPIKVKCQEHHQNVDPVFPCQMKIEKNLQIWIR